MNRNNLSIKLIIILILVSILKVTLLYLLHDCTNYIFHIIYSTSCIFIFLCFEMQILNFGLFYLVQKLIFYAKSFSIFRLLDLLFALVLLKFYFILNETQIMNNKALNLIPIILKPFTTIKNMPGSLFTK